MEKLIVLLKDPHVLTHEKISERKINVQLKGEEIKLITEAQ